MARTRSKGWAPHLPQWLFPIGVTNLAVVILRFSANHSHPESEHGPALNEWKTNSFCDAFNMTRVVLRAIRYLKCVDWASPGWVAFYECHL